MQQRFYSNGKLLLSGEYLVLKGAEAIALPLNVGQDLVVTSTHTELTPSLHWMSYENSVLWFEMKIELKDFKLIECSDKEVANRLIHILKQARTLNENFLVEDQNYEVSTHLDFDRNFGFGTSSTLISNIAEWAHIGPYSLLEKTFGGSGYDIACAKSNSPILFSLHNQLPKIKPIEFNPVFADNLYFVYLGKKQNSANAIKGFEVLDHSNLEIMAITELSKSMIECANLAEFQTLMFEHELIISKILQKPILKDLYPDFKGVMKSLGAWGGDFILAATSLDEKDVKSYFQSKGLNVIFKFAELVKNNSFEK